ncbi:MAG: hypothetical protein LBI67_02715 [Treponema sp.]|jgi:hypothetical protein|nr:hypothetical protein [Treponema sp.]
MVRKNSEKLNFSCLLFAAGYLFAAGCLFLSGCKSSPKPEAFYSDRADSFAFMAPGADIYFNADVASARPILDRLFLGNMSGGEISEFLDMTDSVTAALYSTGPRRFLAAASGRYPSRRGGMFFSTNRDWSKTKSASGINYWHSEKSSLSVYLGASRAYISDADPFAAAPGAERPAGLASLREGAVLSGWMENPGGALDRIISALGIPLRIPAEKLVFGVYRQPAAGTEESAAENPDAALYRATLRLETASGSQAAAIARIFATARLAMAFIDLSAMEGGADFASLVGVFLSRAPEQDGRTLILNTGSMDGRDLALLFNTLSVYSQGS